MFLKRCSLSLSIAFFSLFVGSNSLENLRAQDKKKEIPKMQVVVLKSKSGNVPLVTSWFAPTKGKKSAAVIILHGWKESRTAYEQFGEHLQTQYGYGVIIPDLRGHGESTKDSLGNVITPEKMKGADLMAMVGDIEACKSFLKEKNDAGELNLNLICVIAAGESTIPAMHWIYNDWSFPPLGTIKQGQDVRGLVLLSPVRTFKSASILPLLKEPLYTGKGMPNALATALISANGDKSSFSETKQIQGAMEKLRAPIKVEGEGEERDADEIKKRFVFFFEVDGNAKQSGLLENEGTSNGIVGFIEKKVADRDNELPWETRSPQ